MTFTNTEIEVAGLVFAAVILCTIGALLWALRGSPADDIEDAYLDELIARRGTPAWRRGTGAYDRHEKET